MNAEKIHTAIDYINIAPDFHHPACPLLFRQHDKITTLEDCPFPLKTPTFEVLAFGVNIYLPADERSREDDKFALVRYTKPSCGHTVEERIPFQEGVEDFDHYGTPFKGADYSIQNWERRIERFRNSLKCDVCHMAERAFWLRRIGEGPRGAKAALKQLRFLLDYNYGNWCEFLNWDNVVEKMNATKRRSYD